MALTYRRKPERFQAVQWDGTDERFQEITEWVDLNAAVIDTNTIQHLWNYNAGCYILPSGKMVVGAPYQERCLIVLMEMPSHQEVVRPGEWLVQKNTYDFDSLDDMEFQTLYEEAVDGK